MVGSAKAQTANGALHKKHFLSPQMTMGCSYTQFHAQACGTVPALNPVIIVTFGVLSFHFYQC